jgi:hypothetical protein
VNGAFPKLAERGKRLCRERNDYQARVRGSPPPSISVVTSSRLTNATRARKPDHGWRAGEGGRERYAGRNQNQDLNRTEWNVGYRPGLPIQAIDPRRGDEQSTSGNHIWKLLPVEDVHRRDGGLGPVNKSCSRIWENRPIFHAYSYGILR